MVRVDGRGVSSSLIQVRGLDKKYQRGSEEIDVLQGLNLDVQKGEFVAFMGPSGSVRHGAHGKWDSSFRCTT